MVKEEIWRKAYPFLRATAQYDFPLVPGQVSHRPFLAFVIARQPEEKATLRAK